MTTRLEALKQLENEAQAHLRSYEHECLNMINEFVEDLRKVLGGDEETIALSKDANPKKSGLDENGWYVFFVRVAVTGATDALENKYEFRLYRERGAWRLRYKSDLTALHFDSYKEVEKVATHIVHDLTSIVEKKFFKDRWARHTGYNPEHTEEPVGEVDAA